MTAHALSRLWVAHPRCRATLLLLALPIIALAAGALAKRPLAPARWLAAHGLAHDGGRLVEQTGVVMQVHAWDCGPAALANLLALLRHPVPTTNVLAQLAGTTAEGTSLEQLVLAAHHVGVPLRLLITDPARAPLPTPPYVAWIERRHFVLVAGRQIGDTLTVVDPALGRYRVSASAFRLHWSGAAAVLQNAGADM